MREVKARYVVGLTATPRRRDGQHPIAQFQLGAFRFPIDAKNQAAARPFDHKLVIRRTAFRLSGDATDVSTQAIYRGIAADERRNSLIVDSDVPMLAKTFDKRLRGYQSMDYSVESHIPPELVFP